MAPPPRDPEAASAVAAVDDRRGDGDGGADVVVRRAPFSDNPRVGARGQRTQQRIVDAALRVFGEEGYHQCGVARITELAGCSRASFYQYFSGKEDVFRHLAAQVARQLGASTEALGLVTPDADGWRSIRAWVARYSDVYERYEPVFRRVPDRGRERRRGRRRLGAHGRAARRRVPVPADRDHPAAPPARPGDHAAARRACPGPSTSPASCGRPRPSPYPLERIEDALADVVHRTLFGLQAVNVHPPARRRPPVLEFSPAMQRGPRARRRGAPT